MRSIDTIRGRQHMNQKTERTEEFDNAILTLFPSLDFNRTNVHGQKKKGMKTLLNVLEKAGTEGYVTKYMLTNWKASPRLGGQTAQNALEELELLKLLNVTPTISEKYTPRKDRILTAKGIIACMALPQFQQTDDLNSILGRQAYDGNELASTIKLYNETFVRGTNLDQFSISPAIIIVKKLAEKGFNLELMTEENIANELRRSEEKMFLESLKIDAFDFFWDFLFFLGKQEKEIRNFFVIQLEKNLELFSALGPLSSEEKEELKKSSLYIKEMILLLTSQEFLSYSKINKPESFEKIYDITNKRIEEFEIEFENPFEKLEHSFKMIRKILRENL